MKAGPEGAEEGAGEQGKPRQPGRAETLACMACVRWSGDHGVEAETLACVACVRQS